MKRFYCGIDPGLSGAIAVLDDAGLIIDAIDMPLLTLGTRHVLDLTQLKHSVQLLLPCRERCHVALEKVNAMPGQGVTSMFRQGEAYGIMQGLLAMAGYPVTLVGSYDWKRTMMAGMPKEKDASRIRCSQLWPTETGRWQRKKDHGRCDALLIAEWLRRQEGGG